ncbi:chromatin associated protein [Mycena albidolilacea]|uniref:Chromatin associated protein n=1 Tax=Mycena albidolilacea TaxID=1033008 RepID=A0AAD7EGN2_9AGAR|nr:chromatin associated protein [Mycena albidolilacea]
MNDFLGALDPHAPPPTASSELVKVEGGGRTDGPDWFVVYNPAVKRRVLDVALLHTFVHETVVCCIQFSADGKYLATGCNRTAQIYDVASGRRVCVLADPGPDEKAGMEKAATATGDLYIRSVRFSPDGRYLATGAEDERVRVWDIEKRTIRAVFEGHHQDIYSLDFSADGRRLVSGSGDATVRIWELEEEYEYDEEDRYSSSEYHNGRRRRPPPLVLTAHPETTAPDDDAGVMAVALSPDGTLVAAGCVDALVRVWALAQAPPQNGSRDGSERGSPSLTATLVQVLRGHTNSVHSVVWTKDGSGVVSGALDNTVRVWDLRGTAKREREGKKGMGMTEVGCTVFAGHKDYVLSVGISRDAQWIVSGSKDRGVHFWDRDGVVQCLLQGHKNSVISTSLHPVGNLLATGSGDKLARIWNYNAV